MEEMKEGMLVYVMGPSGAGKDTVLDGVRKQLEGAFVAFAHRYITRPASMGGENHVALSETEFAQRLKAGLFALNWESHKYYYGIGIEIEKWMEQGFTVIMNGSREYLPTAQKHYPDMLPVLITAPPQIIAERLASRGRESQEAIRERLAHNASLEADCLKNNTYHSVKVVNNTTTVEAAVTHFIALLDV